MNRPRGSAIVAFGGGHGLHTSLTALRRITDRLTAVVTVADDGGSSGRLRREFGCLPPGDLRMALAALCGDDQVGQRWASVLQSRFSGDGPLSGHAIGNLLIAGLWQQLDDPVAGLDMVGELLRTRGRVLPMSSVPLQIEADVLGLDPLAPDELCTLAGQATVAKTRATVQSVRLIPENPPAHPEAVAAVRQADAIVMGPGSWFTSVIPHLLVPELREAILSILLPLMKLMGLLPRGTSSCWRSTRRPCASTSCWPTSVSSVPIAISPGSLPRLELNWRLPTSAATTAALATIRNDSLTPTRSFLPAREPNQGTWLGFWWDDGSHGVDPEGENGVGSGGNPPSECA